MVNEQEFEITTTAQVERTYKVRGHGASEKDQRENAHKRLRRHLEDPESLREGLVVEVPEKIRDATPQRVKAVEKGRVLRSAPKPEGAGSAGPSSGGGSA